MSLPYRQEHQLRQISQRLDAADPHLAAMLVIFAQLTVAEQMPARECLRRRLPWLVRALVRAVRAAVALCARVLSPCGRFVHRAAVRRIAACRFALRQLWLARSGRRLAGGPAPSSPPTAFRGDR